MRVEVRTAVIPMAGPADRLGPGMRSVPHALLPVYDTPLIRFAIEEACAAGVERIVLVTRPLDTALHDHAAGFTLPSGIEIALALQPEPLGLGHALLQAAPQVLPGPVAVILPDDLILGEACLADLVERYQSSAAGHMVAVAEVAQEAVRAYGILDPLSRARDGVVRAVGVVEKPEPEEAPSRLAIAGRYVLHPCIFADIKAARTTEAPGDLTRAIARGMDRVGLLGSPVGGQWFDCAWPDGLLDAAIALRRMRRAGPVEVALLRQAPLKIAAE